MKNLDLILSPQDLSTVKGGSNATGAWRWDNTTQQWVWIEGVS